jgi:hypothetical protein
MAYELVKVTTESDWRDYLRRQFCARFALALDLRCKSCQNPLQRLSYSTA